MTTGKQGKVYLVGAGPGAPDLLTLRAWRCLGQADVVLYDRLVDPRVLRCAPAEARLVYVGKRPGQSHSQAWIQRLAIAEARKGRLVVRLKGGDPFVYGRGGEEAEALERAGVDWEVVPGLTSAVAVPALAGIPVLHRHYASMLMVVAGHHGERADMAVWAACLAQSGTLVILMGMANLGVIAHGLQRAGVAADMPVAVIESGTSAREKRVVGSLGDIQSRVQSLGTPAVIVVGRVVALHDTLNVCTAALLSGRARTE